MEPISLAMAMEIEGTVIADRFKITTRMESFKGRWLADNKAVEGMKAAFPELRDDTFTAKNLNRGLKGDEANRFKSIYEEGSTNTTGVYAKTYRFDPTYCGVSKQRHSFYFITKSKDKPPAFPKQKNIVKDGFYKIRSVVVDPSKQIRCAGIIIHICPKQ